MAEDNHTVVREFILMGFTESLMLKRILFVLFLNIYLTTLVGNLGMTGLVRVEPQLHTPMYFFLSNLSFVDACYSSTIAPRMLVDFLVEKKTISLGGCATQLCFFIVFATTDILLLAVMAYDRYVAICNPLLYPAMVSRKTCFRLVAGCFLGGSLSSLIHTSFTFQLSFCHSNIIHHYFCDIPPLLALSCSDTRINEILIFSLGSLELAVSLSTIFFSYLFILITILRIRSAEGRLKAFSTCTSHLTAIVLLYGTLIFMYLRPSSSSVLDQKPVMSVLYTMVIPMLNPLIYSLRNREVKNALRRVLERKMVSWSRVGRSEQMEALMRQFKRRQLQCANLAAYNWKQYHCESSELAKVVMDYNNGLGTTSQGSPQIFKEDLSSRTLAFQIDQGRTIPLQRAGVCNLQEKIGPVDKRENLTTLDKNLCYWLTSLLSLLNLLLNTENLDTIYFML
ncbi:olfactory receptor 1052-like [Tachyglossus aculeatus]|uniref:olfactory receptor 1052-like n=1 Tax=Tachyglossus aculeatus TaxID=9261 RepID=UPI0018F5C386|nr:olfactory receptor 1052-like [Tachyglossus aculeatus]